MMLNLRTEDKNLFLLLQIQMKLLTISKSIMVNHTEGKLTLQHIFNP